MRLGGKILKVLGLFKGLEALYCIFYESFEDDVVFVGV